MSNFHKSFIKRSRYTWFFFFNVGIVLSIIVGIIFMNYRNYNRVNNFLRRNYLRFMELQPFIKSSPVQHKDLAFENIEIVNEEKYITVVCTVNTKIKNYYLFVHKLSSKIKELDPQYEIHCKNLDKTVKIQVFPIIDKTHVEKIISIIESYCLPS